jgi:hypothetical protein
VTLPLYPHLPLNSASFSNAMRGALNSKVSADLIVSRPVAAVTRVIGKTDTDFSTQL